MKTPKMSTGMCAALCALTCLVSGNVTAAPRNLLWTGAVSTTWDFNAASLNWIDRDAENSPAVVYRAGDNVLFDDTLTPTLTSVYVPAPGGTLAPTDVMFNIANTVVVTGGEFFTRWGRLEKTGPGTLIWRFTTSSGSNAYPVYISGGCLQLDEPNQMYAYMPNGVVPREYVIGAGAELRVTQRNCLGKVDNYISRASVKVLKGGLFSLSIPDKLNHAGSAVHTLTFDGGEISLNAKGADSKYGLLLITSKLCVTGDTPVVVANGANFSSLTDCQFLAINRDAPVTFDIANVTGNDEPDLTLTVPLTHYHENYQNAKLVKTGAGTMLLNKIAHSNFRANVDVREGVLRLDWENPNAGQAGQPASNTQFGQNSLTVLGNMETAGRTITVQSRLEMYNRNLFCAYGGGENGGNRVQSEVVVTNGGTLFLWAPQNFGPLTFVDGTLELDANKDWGWGAIGVRGPVTIRGTTPVTWTAPAAESNTGRQILYREYATSFDVADVTGDAAADFTTELPLVLPSHLDYTTNSLGVRYSYGFNKTGAGTCVLKGDDRKQNALAMNGEARVQAGTLQIDGALSKATAVVSAGAYVSGTGLVHHVSLAAGAGFRKAARTDQPLVATGTVTLGEQCIIRLDNPDNLPLYRVKAAILAVSGTLADEANLENVVVYLDDVCQPPTRYTVTYENGTVMVQGLDGTTVIVR